MNGGEIDVRERVAQILGETRDTQGIEIDEAQGKFLTGRLEDAVANFFSGGFAVAAPKVELVSSGDTIALSNAAVVVVLQLHEADSRVHVALDAESAEVLISHCFGKSDTDNEPAAVRALTKFDRTVVADFAFKIVRDIWGNNDVEKIVFEEADLGALLSPTPSFLMRWPISVGANMMHIAVYAAASLVAPKGAGEPERFKAKNAVNETWHAHMERALGQTSILVDAMIEGPEMTLGDVAAFRVGQVVELGDASGLGVTLGCEGSGLFEGEMGRKEGRFAVTVVRALGNLPEHLGPNSTSSNKGSAIKFID